MNEKGRREKVKRRFLQWKIFYFTKLFSQKKKIPKRDISGYKKGFLKTLKKGSKEDENKKKENHRKETRKNKICKRYKEREKKREDNKKYALNEEKTVKKEEKKEKQTKNGTCGKNEKKKDNKEVKKTYSRRKIFISNVFFYQKRETKRNEKSRNTRDFQIITK